MKNVVALKTIEAGERFTFNGQKFIALEQLEEGTLAITEECIEDRAFNDRRQEILNDWKTSSLREYLNKEYLEAQLDEEALLEMEVDLTADDGLDDYGKDKCKVALLSLDQYRKYRKVLGEPIEDWWWLVTPYSTASNGFSRHVRFVGSGGSSIGTSAYYGLRGVRPLCTLKSEILVSKG